MKACPLIVLATLLTVPTPLTCVAHAQASAPNSAKYVAVYCKDVIVPAGLASSVGECVSLENTSFHFFDKGSDGFATHWCALLRDDYPDEYDTLFGGSWTECVHYAHQAIGN